MKCNFQIEAIFHKTSHDIFIHLLKWCFWIRKKYLQSKIWKDFAKQMCSKPKSNPNWIYKTQSLSDHNIVKFWKSKNFKNTLWGKGLIKTDYFIMTLFMQNLWQIPTSIVPLSGGGGRQGTELEGPTAGLRLSPTGKALSSSTWGGAAGLGSWSCYIHLIGMCSHGTKSLQRI